MRKNHPNVRRVPASLYSPKLIATLVAGSLTVAPATAQMQEDRQITNPTIRLMKRAQPGSQNGSLDPAACTSASLQSGDCQLLENGPNDKYSVRNDNAIGKKAAGRVLGEPSSGLLEDLQYERIVEEPTEFQRFVESSVGQKLPIYGASLFDRVPSTYAPVDRVPVAPDYTVGPGDELDIRIWGQISSEQRLLVDRTGDIFIPQVGRINVAGLHFGELDNALKSSISRVYRNFELSVTMGQLRSIQIFVMGHARRPGTYTVSSLSTLVNALFVSGGPSSQGSMRNIQLKRGGQLVTRFDMYDLLLHGDKTKDVSLKPGDVIFIPPVGPRVAVSGSIENPAIYEIEEHCSLRDLLGDAGGLSPVAAGQHAVLERIDHRSTLVSESIDLGGPGLNTAVQDGDIVNLLKVVPRFSQTVAVKGNVADPIRMPWHEGMRVSDLIPEKQALLTRDYWAEHNRLSSGSGEAIEEIRKIMIIMIITTTTTVTSNQHIP